jgi:hypothetical protein
MHAFRTAVEETVRRALVQHHTVQGFIPRGGVDFTAWTCTVRVPDQHQAAESGTALGGGSYLEYSGVPMPRQPDGVIYSPKAKVWEQDCGVLVGFRGSDLFPYIVDFLDLLHPVDGKEKANVATRQTVLTHQFLTNGPVGPATLSTQHLDLPLPRLSERAPAPPPLNPGPSPYGYAEANQERTTVLLQPLQHLLRRQV